MISLSLFLSSVGVFQLFMFALAVSTSPILFHLADATVCSAYTIIKFVYVLT